jgi:hypothetical protein
VKHLCFEAIYTQTIDFIVSLIDPEAAKPNSGLTKAEKEIKIKKNILIANKLLSNLMLINLLRNGISSLIINLVGLRR